MICIEIDEFLYENDEFCIKNGDFNANIEDALIISGGGPDGYHTLEALQVSTY